MIASLTLSNQSPLYFLKSEGSDDEAGRSEAGSDSDDDDDSDASRASSSSDDEHQWKQSVKEQYRKIQKERKQQMREEKYLKEKAAAKNSALGNGDSQVKEPKFFELKDGVEYFGSGSSKKPNELIYNEKL